MIISHLKRCNICFVQSLTCHIVNVLLIVLTIYFHFIIFLHNLWENKWLMYILFDCTGIYCVRVIDHILYGMKSQHKSMYLEFYYIFTVKTHTLIFGLKLISSAYPHEVKVGTKLHYVVWLSAKTLCQIWKPFVYWLFDTSDPNWTILILA